LTSQNMIYHNVAFSMRKVLLSANYKPHKHHIPLIPLIYSSALSVSHHIK